MNSEPSEPVSPLEAHLGFWLRFVSNEVSSRFESLLAAQGVSLSEWVALRVLYQRSDATHAELIEMLGMTKGAASKIVSRLEARGLADRRSADGSLRNQVLCLSEAGNALLPRLAALADENDAHFFSHLPEAQRQALMQLLQSLVERHRLGPLPVR